MFLLVLSITNHLRMELPCGTNNIRTSRLPLLTIKTFNKLAGRPNSIRRKSTAQNEPTHINAKPLGKPMASKFDGPNKKRQSARPNCDTRLQKNTQSLHIKISFLSTDATYRPYIGIVWYIAVISFPFRIYSQFRNRSHHMLSAHTLTHRHRHTTPPTHNPSRFTDRKRHQYILGHPDMANIILCYVFSYMGASALYIWRNGIGHIGGPRSN